MGTNRESSIMLLHYSVHFRFATQANTTPIFLACTYDRCLNSVGYIEKGGIMSSNERRIPLEEAECVASELVSRLQDACHRIEVVGSVRRRKPSVGDIEILYIPREGLPDPTETRIMKLITKGILEVRGGYGEWNKLMVHPASGIKVDLFKTTRGRWPVSLAVRTGPRESNIAVATAAKRKGWKFHSYGTGFTDQWGREVACHSEREVFELVGLEYKSPEKR